MNLELRTMAAADIALGMRLKQAAGWTQIEADWRRALDLEPDGCFVAEADGAGVGTVATCLFGPIAWIAMVLVDQPCRGLGIGRALLERAIHYCESRQADSIRLDATPLGRPLYASLGFRDDFELTRYRGMPQPNESALGSAEAFRSADLAGILAIDRAATATDREKLLRALIEHERQQTLVVRTSHGLEGFCSGRPGAGALQIGPCIATAAAGPRLLAAAIGAARSRPVVIDVLAGQAEAIRMVEDAGLQRERCFTRMTRGRPVREDLPSQWASFGPEKG
ncbi:MAG TPA: GNAT family N-acetyltransferase [Pirellulales bacterium]|nr:GNAT family N-acetyltransferase [Pirellulales bacterium]